MINNRLLLVVKIIAVATLLIVLLIHFSEIPPQIPLFYSLSKAEDQVVNSVYLFLIPIIGVLFLLLNNIITKMNKDQELMTILIRIINIFIFISICAIIVKLILLVT